MFMLLILLGVCLVLSLTICAAGTAPASVFPREHWEHRSPSEVGLNPTRLEEFASFIEAGTDNPSDERHRRIGCVVRDGYMVYSWGDQSTKLDWFSSSKPVVSTMLLFAVHSGLLPNVDARIADLGWPLIEKDRGMTFAHLANQISGYALAEPSGTAYAYNDLALQLYVLSLEKVFAKSLNEAAMGYLSPLQLEDGDVINARRRTFTTPRDFARIGWFWMHRGNWAGRQVLPQAYFDAYMRPLIPPDMPRSKTLENFNDYLNIASYGGGSNQSGMMAGVYGFNWWFNGPIATTGVVAMEGVPTDLVMALGARGSNMVMLPTQRLLVAARGSWEEYDEAEAAKRAPFTTAMKMLLAAIDRP